MNRIGLGLLLLIAVLGALAVTILLTAPNVRAQQLDRPLGAMPCCCRADAGDGSVS
jgi:hypothetical protein